MTAWGSGGETLSANRTAHLVALQEQTPQKNLIVVETMYESFISVSV